MTKEKFVSYWEKSVGFVGAVCELCGNSNSLNEVFRRKFNRREDLEPQNDDPCLITLCEKCFIKSR
jgi:hypothetical protein